MQRHPADLAGRWLLQAEYDLESAEASASGGRWSLVCFLAQQCVEKALKGALVWERGDFQRIHLIDKLLADLIGVDPPVLDEDTARRARGLDKYYLTTRYPDVLDYALPSESFTREDAELTLAIARDVCASIRRHLTSAGVFDA